MRDYCIILNPAAKAARDKQVAWQLATVAKDARVCLTEAPGHATLLAKQAASQGFKTIVAGGGDGTVNEVLQGIVGLDVRLGVLPLGTMNVFARELALPLDWEDAWARILRGGCRRVDLGHANGLPIAQLAGVGFDAEVVQSVSTWSKMHFGPLAYVDAALRRLAKPLPRLTVEASEIGSRPAAWVLVGLGRLYGGPFPVFPRGSNTSGLLDVLLVERFDVESALRSVARMAWAGHTHLPGITYLQTSELHVSSRPTPEGHHSDPALEIDGEWRGRAPVKFGITRGGINVAV